MEDEMFTMKVTIAGRVYPMTVPRAEEGVIREAARMINNKIAQYKEKHAQADPFDLLSITAVQFTVELIAALQNVEPILEGIRKVNRKLDEFVAD
ncbi:MAG: cell division protein ZapA [Odoribacteraceae bacterium]|jgi:cell division protein ZapA|nr:cell division protein ZapA [Odoribacteraceae bacterium]